MTPTNQHDENVAHEHGDINFRTVLLAALALATVVGVVMVVVWGVFRVLAHEAAASDPQLSPLAIPAGQLPPEPRLQINEPAGLKMLRDAEARTLDEYGWIDQKSGIAHVPIAEAKKLLLERGLPSRAGAVDPLEGTHASAYGEATGGRSLGRKQ